MNPLIDQMAESVVRDDGSVVELLHCDRAGEVTCGYPFLYAGPLVGLSGTQGDRIGEELEADWASEQVGYRVYGHSISLLHETGRTQREGTEYSSKGTEAIKMVLGSRNTRTYS